MTFTSRKIKTQAEFDQALADIRHCQPKNMMDPTDAVDVLSMATLVLQGEVDLAGVHPKTRERVKWLLDNFEGEWIVLACNVLIAAMVGELPDEMPKPADAFH